MNSIKKLIVITGASSGIGAATARIFAKHNHPLLLLSRTGNHPDLYNSMSLQCDVTKYQ